MRNRQNISLPNLLSYYSSKEQLNNYEDKHTLLNQLIDLKTLFQFANTNFPTKMKTLKKKADDYLNHLQRATDTLIDFTERQIPQLLICKANQKMAYDILAKSTHQRVEDIINQQDYNIEFQMKLKFLESQGIQSYSWLDYYDKQNKILNIGDQKIRIKVCLQLINKKYKWAIKQVQYLDKINYKLTQYYIYNFIPWIFNTFQNSQVKILKYLIKSINFCQSVLLFKSIQQKSKIQLPKKYQLGYFKLSVPINQKYYQFIFPTVQTDDKPYFKLVKNKIQILNLPMDNKFVKGTLTIQNIQLSCDFISHNFDQNILIEFVNNIYKYQNQIINLYNLYNIKIQNKLFLLLKDHGNYWKYSYLQLTDIIIQQTKINGLYLLYYNNNNSQPIIIQITQNLNLQSKYIQSGLIENMIKQYSLNQMFLHLQLKKQIIKDNGKYQYKIYQMSYNHNQGLIYLFRQHKFIQAQHRIDKNQENYQQIQDYIIKIQIPKNFKNIFFYCYRPKSLSKSLNNDYHTQSWKNYILNKLADQYLSIYQIKKCLKHLLLHFQIKRFSESINDKNIRDLFKIKLE